MPSLLPEIRDSIVAHNLDIVSASKMQLTDEMLLLAQQFSKIYGRVRVTNEAGGIHLYMPCVDCLRDYGADELHKMHLAVNVTKYYEAEGDQDMGVALCMKTSKPYSVAELLSEPPLDKQGYEIKPQVLEVARTQMEYMEYDANGALIPKGPGTVVPVYTLPTCHPAQVYLRSRNFDAEILWHQFRLSYCTKERKDMYFRRQLNGFRASPQGRIIFYADQDGINKGWQSRILQLDKNDIRYYFHPYTGRWTPVQRKVNDKWVPFDERWVGFDPVKYFIGPGCHRNECLMGFDAAMPWSKRRCGEDESWCVLAEGALDAARVGPPAMALLGKSMSPNQAKLVGDNFSQVIYVKDNDEAGEKGAASVIKRLGELPGHQPKLHIAAAPSGKDLGDMEPSPAKQFIQNILHG